MMPRSNHTLVMQNGNVVFLRRTFVMPKTCVGKRQRLVLVVFWLRGNLFHTTRVFSPFAIIRTTELDPIPGTSHSIGFSKKNSRYTGDAIRIDSQPAQAAQQENK
jgi:hypothetical protein